MWINSNAGVVMLIFGILLIAMLGVALWILFTLRRQFCVQRLKFTGLYAEDRVTHTKYASLTIGNRSVRELAIKEIGIKNGGIAFDLTALYRYKTGLDERAHIVIEQRYSIDFTLSIEELKGLLTEEKSGRLGTLRLYAVDLVGTLYQGKIEPVRKLLSDAMRLQNAVGVPRRVVDVPQPPKETESSQENES